MGEFTLTYPTLRSCTYPTETPPYIYHHFNGRAMCAVYDIQHVIFGNSQSSDKFTGKPKIFSHPTSSQESLKQQINVYIYIAHHIRGQWKIPIYSQIERNLSWEVISPLWHVWLIWVIFFWQLTTPLTRCNDSSQQYCYKMPHNWLILDWSTFYFIVQFSRLTYYLSTRKLCVLYAAQVWIHYLSNWRLYW